VANIGWLFIYINAAAFTDAGFPKALNIVAANLIKLLSTL
jgi:hypothetical protein